MRLLKKKEVANYKAGTQSILKAAFDNGVKVYEFLKNERIFIFKKNQKKVWLRGPRISLSNPVALWIIKDKYLTKEVLKEIGIPCPNGYPAKNAEEAVDIAKKIGFPVVVKPRRYEGGIGVFLNIDNEEKVKKFFKRSSFYDKQVLVEKYVEGKYYRIIMVNKKIAGILETKGIAIVGDGKSTVKKLIENYNSTNINYKITKKTNDVLLFQGLTVNSVPKKNKSFILGFSGAEGGNWTDRTDEICKENSKLLKKLADYLDLNVAGIDLIAKNISLPITHSKSPGYILEINGAPEFIFHLNPTHGKPRNIGKEIIKMLFEHK